MTAKILSLVAMAAVLGGAPITGQGTSGAAGGSRVAHLYLAEKDAAWTPVPGGAWGKLTFRMAGPAFRFVFRGHRLEPGVEYALIYYPDPWPGAGALCLARGLAGTTGDLHLRGAPDTGDLPFATDWNADPATMTAPSRPPSEPRASSGGPHTASAPTTGAKIWLVLAADVNCGVGMIGWHPADYLFEMQLVTYVKTP